MTLSGHRLPPNAASGSIATFAQAIVLTLLLSVDSSTQLLAQDLERQLASEPAATLARAAREEGDAKRGAILFHQPHLACAKCHVEAEPAQRLGPDLAGPADEARRISDELLVEAILSPSKVIRPGFETIVVSTTDGESIQGLLVEDRADSLVLRDVGQAGKLITLSKKQIDRRQISAVSLMPAGQANQLTSRQQFLDLVKYLIEIRDGGPPRALALQPDPSLVAALELPEYETQLDHAGLIGGWNAGSLQRGEAIYLRICANCHGTHEMAGTLPTALRFAEGKLKNGSDPLAMYQTLTRGFGLMVPQTWMVPQQKYDVIHYIREAYLKERNPSQYFAVDDDYLARLPRGNTVGPQPSMLEPWVVMDYGPRLINTYEIPSRQPGLADADRPNFAYKGIAVRLDPGAGGISRGREWAIFDHDTLRLAAIWSGRGFIDWNGIQFNGRHQVHPTITGRVLASNPVGPGWAHPVTGSFDDPRLRGRDDRPYGPLPRRWAQYRGLYQHADRTIVSYTVGNTSVLESSRLVSSESAPLAAVETSPSAPPATMRSILVRDFHLGPRDRPLTLLVATRPGSELQSIDTASDQQEAVFLAPPASAANTAPRPPAASERALVFGGTRQIEIDQPQAFDMTGRDFSIAARIRTHGDGSLFSQAAAKGPWIRDGKAWFVRGGKLVFDIGWVGAVTSRTRIDDGKWHTVGMSWQHVDGEVRLYIDGKMDGQGRLKPKATRDDFVVRLGYTAANFPAQTYFTGEMAWASFHQHALTADDFRKLTDNAAQAPSDALAAWSLGAGATEELFRDRTGNGRYGRLIMAAEASPESEIVPLAAGFTSLADAHWRKDESGRVLLDLPAGPGPLRFSVWLSRTADATTAAQVARDAANLVTAPDLTEFTAGGPPRWPQRITTPLVRGADEGPFAVDILTAPASNPWLAQTRLSGLDFFPGGDRAAVCSWDGDVWLVSGFLGEQSPSLQWQRIASGLFQPLGLKIIAGQIHVTCRDQIVILRDMNGDGETDFYECFNNDQQVTEHFHEFAMGLQADAEGNLYYAKSARHALPAVVPQHGTLLRVSRDGSRTDIIANGFRAANGVCLNPDGSFVVTDQEGHWNPKNRINWVTLDPSGKPKFYGNMFGYHDVTDSSDAAMEPPLCWITNEFDRSPAELVWVHSEKWGPLNGSLLNLSYGYGKVFVVPHERVGGAMQGGMAALPIPLFPTGLTRGRFNPADGQLYLCGMFAWGGNATQPGGLYRLRATGKPMHLPLELHARKARLELTFTEPLDAASLDPRNVQITTWSLKRTANYGSQHFDEQPLAVKGLTLSRDGRTLEIDVPDVSPTWCMEIKFALRSRTGQPFQGTIHNTIHRLAE